MVALEQAVAAPFCSRQLADLGADVIKVERPDGGDMARGYDRALRGVSTYFAWLNRGKRSIVLDLKSPEDLAVCRRLVERADVFLHNLAQGAVERLGLGYDELAARRPGLVWCGISGYGPDGPARRRKAYDLLVQGEAGAIAITGSPEAMAKVGISIADIAAGMYAFSSVLAALFGRSRSGLGERIDISMLECLAEWMTQPMYYWHGYGEPPPRAGVRHHLVVPYGAFDCADGAVIFAVQNEREWRRFCTTVLERPDLVEDERFATNAARLAHREALEGLIEARFGAERRAQVLARLEAADLATAAVHDVPAVAAHPQLLARQRWTTVASAGGPLPALLPPHNLAHAAPRLGPIPSLGEHSAEIRAELAAEGG